MRADPAPSPSPVTCIQVLKKCDEVVTAKNKVIEDYKRIVKDQESLNFTLKQENRGKDSELTITRVFATLGILGGIIAGIFIGRSSR